MPRYNISTPRPTRRDRAREADELALEQDRTAAASQNAMINQAVQLYGLSQARAMQPEQMRRMKLENDAMQHELQWAQANSEARHAATMGLAGQRNDKVGMSPAEVAQLVQWGIWTPEQGREAVMTPEQKAAAAQTKATSDFDRQVSVLGEDINQARAEGRGDQYGGNTMLERIRRAVTEKWFRRIHGQPAPPDSPNPRFLP